VPFVKICLVLWALYHRDGARRQTLHFVEGIAKWAMADVFAVSLFIAYLAAQASQAPPGPGFMPSLVTFPASFGPGFYWFAAYCLASLAIQQATARWVSRWLVRIGRRMQAPRICSGEGEVCGAAHETTPTIEWAVGIPSS
jgi:hypothetical protein